MQEVARKCSWCDGNNPKCVSCGPCYLKIYYNGEFKIFWTKQEHVDWLADFQKKHPGCAIFVSDGCSGDFTTIGSIGKGIR